MSKQKHFLPTLSKMVDNVLEVYHNATREEIQEGLDWYAKAHLIAKAFAKQYNVTVGQASGVIAALSPRNKWERNILDAENVLRLGDKAIVGTFNASKAKAVQIAQGSKTNEDILNILAGPKTQDFYRIIVDPTDSYSVCVDIWAFRIVARTEPKGSLLRMPHYTHIGNAYRKVSEITGLLPWQVQAITWVAVRNNWQQYKSS